RDQMVRTVDSVTISARQSEEERLGRLESIIGKLVTGDSDLRDSIKIAHDALSRATELISRPNEQSDNRLERFLSDSIVQRQQYADWAKSVSESVQNSGHGWSQAEEGLKVAAGPRGESGRDAW